MTRFVIVILMMYIKYWQIPLAFMTWSTDQYCSSLLVGAGSVKGRSLAKRGNRARKQTLFFSWPLHFRRVCTITGRTKSHAPRVRTIRTTFQSTCCFETCVDRSKKSIHDNDQGYSKDSSHLSICRSTWFVLGGHWNIHIPCRFGRVSFSRFFLAHLELTC